MEADTRTTLTVSPGCHLHAKSRAEDIALLARDFASSLCWGCGFWYYDFGQGWYDAPEFNELFGKIFPIRREITDCRSISEVLVVGDSLRKDILPAESLGCQVLWLKGKGWTADEDAQTHPNIITSIQQVLDFV